MKTKIYSLFLTLIVNIGTLFASTKIGNVWYNLNANTKTAEVVLGYAGCYSGNVVIPSTVTSGSMTYNVTSIGQSALLNCTNVTSIVIGDNVTNIGYGAFSGCTNLTSVTIGKSVSTLPMVLFQNCSKLTTICWNAVNFPDFQSSSNNPLPTTLTSFTFGNEVKHIPANLCANMSNLTAVNISNSVISIGKEAFTNCPNMISLTIGNGVREIEENAFSNCSSLTSILIPENITYIGSNAFDNCTNLSTVTWNARNCANYVSASKMPFSSCSNITSFTFGNTVENIPDYCCYSLGLNGIISIPDGVTYIGNYAFAHCTGLTSVTIPNSVVCIGSGAFYGCSGLTSATIGNGITEIGGYAFGNCSSLLSASIPDGVTNLGDGAFNACASLTSIYIGTGVASIGPNTFTGCNSLTSISIGHSTEVDYYTFQSSNISEIHFLGSIEEWCNWSSENKANIAYDYALYVGENLITDLVIPSSLNIISGGSFRGCNSLTSIEIPGNVTSIGEQAFVGCSNLTSINVAENNPNYSSIDGVLFNKDKTILLQYPTGKQGEYTIPNSVESIGNNAFYNCSGLTSVALGNNVTSIGDYAFNMCWELSSITFPNTITNIGQYAFFNCINLDSISIPSSVTSVGTGAFTWCDNLVYIYINSNAIVNHNVTNYFGRQVKEYVLGDSITSIGESAFNSCDNLTSITIGCNVSYIHYTAFYHCDKLTSLTINSEEALNNYLDDIIGKDKLTNCVIGDSIKWIRDNLFRNYSNLASITIPNSVTEVGKFAFYGCNSLPIENNIRYADTYAIEAIDKTQTEYTLKRNTRFIGESAFQNCSNLSSIVLPNSVIYIGDSAYMNCNLTSLILSDSLRHIGNCAFRAATKFSSDEPFILSLPESLTYIGSYAFFCCWHLQSLKIPNAVTKIGRTAFAGCSNLEYVSLPASLLDLGAEVFYSCSNIKSVICNAEIPPTMGGNINNDYNQIVFFLVDCEEVPLFVPAESIEAYKEAYQWEEFTHIYPIEYADEINTSEVTATANEDNSVTVEWPIIEDAVIYTIEIKKNGELVCTLEFNEEGQLISKVFAMPSRNGNRQTKSATQTANGWEYTIDGLDSGTEYTYTITAKKGDDTEVFTQTITFSTLSHEGIENIETNGDNTTKIIHNGQIYILRGDKTYTIQGQEVK